MKLEQFRLNNYNGHLPPQGPLLPTTHMESKTSGVAVLRRKMTIVRHSCISNPYNVELFLLKEWRLKGYFQIEIIINVLVLSFRVHLSTYVMRLRPLIIFEFFQCGDRLFTSESDVYRRQILTYKGSPHAERVKTYMAYCQRDKTTTCQTLQEIAQRP